MNDTVLIVLGFTLPCLMTTLGALLVFFFKRTSKIVNMLTIGLAAGIMLSASIWSLLVPALENARQDWGSLAFLPVVLGFVLGGLLMLLLDWVSNLMFKEGGSARRKAFKMFTAITVHNVPEGLSVGFAIGTAVALHTPMFAALMFALGIALQNFPEGLATALPLFSSLGKKGKAFFLATLSGVVEPLFALVGFFLAAYISSLLPWLLSFAAGAMIYVIVEEMLPEIQSDDGKKWGIWAFVLGFVVMMILDIIL